ncbi:hypothetical protein QR680_013315 [Steinernema hermaphroditum]|uniref:Rho GDP-dissociation inhibitor n=1 Tax=Steinernema hermaphroditum TaxID=289476 RepID=A0AA39I749_9BILA|nr:hypothetical protein QR680_013315 [Steinernema hermaphroditum]
MDSDVKAVQDQLNNQHFDDEDEHSQNFQAPAQRTVKEILETDANDESLNRYKERLLGSVSATPIVVDNDDSRKVIPRRLSLTFDGRPDMTLEVGGGEGNNVVGNFKIKEGVSYKVKFEFQVQREIVTGLRYVHKVTRHGIPITNEKFMVGSYAPSQDMIVFTTGNEEAPSGMLGRGTYNIQSAFRDDDKNMYAEFRWTVEVAKDW